MVGDLSAQRVVYSHRKLDVVHLTIRTVGDLSRSILTENWRAMGQLTEYWRLFFLDGGWSITKEGDLLSPKIVTEGNLFLPKIGGYSSLVRRHKKGVLYLCKPKRPLSHSLSEKVCFTRPQ